MIDKLPFPSAALRPLDSSPANRTGQASQDPDRDEFAAVLADFASQAITTMRHGEDAAVAGIKGAAPIQEVVDKVMAAEHALQSAMAIRERVVAAYLDISRMTI